MPGSNCWFTYFPPVIIQSLKIRVLVNADWIKMTRDWFTKRNSSVKICFFYGTLGDLILKDYKGTLLIVDQRCYLVPVAINYKSTLRFYSGNAEPGAGSSDVYLGAAGMIRSCIFTRVSLRAR